MGTNETEATWGVGRLSIELDLGPLPEWDGDPDGPPRSMSIRDAIIAEAGRVLAERVRSEVERPIREGYREAYLRANEEASKALREALAVKVKDALSELRTPLPEMVEHALSSRSRTARGRYLSLLENILADEAETVVRNHLRAMHSRFQLWERSMDAAIHESAKEIVRAGAEKAFRLEAEARAEAEAEEVTG